MLRDFGDTLLTFAYPHIPLFVANAAFILVVVYTVRKGIEVLTRTGELFFCLGEFTFNDLHASDYCFRHDPFKQLETHF
ncbi:GerAB/ArcD/ProY family transporter [Peribacillus frigoritolerans]|nr:GerAB/ArcD/ProY family transporter [Peribacillus frigoritolerans]